MFPTTIWTTIRAAGAQDGQALESFARSYRDPVLRFLKRRGFRDGDAEDLCQEVFLRLLEGRVLERADSAKGRFRSLLLTVATRIAHDRLRKRRESAMPEAEPADPRDEENARDPEFDRAWALHLTERAMTRLREKGSPYHAVLRGHLTGEKQDRNKLWIARRQLSALIRDEVAQTCSSHAEFEEELAYLEQFLRPRKKA